jgi:hypothetical protein
MSEIIRPKVSLIKQESSRNQAQKEIVPKGEAPIVSQQGVVFDRRTNSHGRQFLVARGGDLSRPPTFRHPSWENKQSPNVD